MKPFDFDRKFQAWRYSVSHGQLLLRSTKDENHGTQVDVLFKNVVFIQLPACFSGLRISEMPDQEFRSLNLPLGLFSAEGKKCFRLEGAGWTGLVVAGVMAWSEEDAEHFAASKLFFPGAA